MLNVFKGFLFVVFIICDGMSGVSVGKSITFSDCQEFFHKTEDDFKDVVSITFENQAIDDEFILKWEDVQLCREINTLRFNHCRFQKCYLFNGLSVKNLIFNDCGLSAKNVDKILEVNPDAIESIDLSNNNLAQDEKKLEKVFLDKLTMTRFAMDLILKGNNLSENFKSLIKANKRYDRGIKFIF